MPSPIDTALQTLQTFLRDEMEITEFPAKELMIVRKSWEDGWCPMLALFDHDARALRWEHIPVSGHAAVFFATGGSALERGYDLHQMQQRLNDAIIVSIQGRWPKVAVPK